MSRSGAITFKGAPLTLAGKEVAAGQPATDFKLHYFDGGMHELTLADLKGKPTLISVVPSLDTPVCATQTRTFNKAAAGVSGDVAILTASLDLPFAQKRFCGAEGIDAVVTASDYKYHSFGETFGVLIKELGLLTRAVFVIDAGGKVTHAEYVAEATHEPNYEMAMNAVKAAL